MELAMELWKVYWVYIMAVGNVENISARISFRISDRLGIAGSLRKDSSL
jgi:hypothetical protein